MRGCAVALFVKSPRDQFLADSAFSRMITLVVARAIRLMESNTWLMASVEPIKSPCELLRLISWRRMRFSR